MRTNREPKDFIHINFKTTIFPPQENMKAWVESVEDSIKDLSEFWRKWGQSVVKKEFARIFLTQGYGTWAPLRGKYAKWKAKKHPGKTILRLKDRYFKAMVNSNATGNLFVTKPTYMEWGIDESKFANAFGKSYPNIHEGEPRLGTSHIKRPTVELASSPIYGKQMWTDLEKATRDYLAKVVRKEWGHFIRQS